MIFKQFTMAAILIFIMRPKFYTDRFLCMMEKQHSYFEEGLHNTYRRALGFINFILCYL